MKKLLCIDLDGTLTPNSTWYELNLRLGLSPEEDKQLFNQHLEGDINYTSWIAALVELYHTKNTPVSKMNIMELAQSLPIVSDGPFLIETAKERGYEILLLSGSVDTIVEIFAKRLGIEYWRACSQIVYDENEKVIDLETMGEERIAKLALLEAFCQERDIDLSNVIAVSDGGNDLVLFQNVRGIRVGDKPDLAEAAWKNAPNLAAVRALI